MLDFMEENCKIEIKGQLMKSNSNYWKNTTSSFLRTTFKVDEINIEKTYSPINSNANGASHISTKHNIFRNGQIIPLRERLSMYLSETGSKSSKRGSNKSLHKNIMKNIQKSKSPFVLKVPRLNLQSISSSVKEPPRIVCAPQTDGCCKKQKHRRVQREIKEEEVPTLVQLQDNHNKVVGTVAPPASLITSNTDTPLSNTHSPLTVHEPQEHLNNQVVMTTENKKNNIGDPSELLERLTRISLNHKEHKNKKQNTITQHDSMQTNNNFLNHNISPEKSKQCTVTQTNSTLPLVEEQQCIPVKPVKLLVSQKTFDAAHSYRMKFISQLAERPEYQEQAFTKPWRIVEQISDDIIRNILSKIMYDR